MNEKIPLPEIPPHSEFFERREDRILFFYRFIAEMWRYTVLNDPKHKISPAERKIISAVASREWEMHKYHEKLTEPEIDRNTTESYRWLEWGGWYS